MPSTEMIRQAVQRYCEAVQAMDVEAWVATFAKDGLCQDPVGGPPVRGHEALAGYVRNITQAFKRIGFEDDHVFVSGNFAAVKWTARGVGLNDREVVFEGIDVFEINDEGLIQSLFGYWDPSAMMAQLGA